MKLTFNGDVTELMLLIKQMQEAQCKPLADAITNELPEVLDKMLSERADSKNS